MLFTILGGYLMPSDVHSDRVSLESGLFCHVLFRRLATQQRLGARFNAPSGILRLLRCVDVNNKASQP